MVWYRFARMILIVGLSVLAGATAAQCARWLGI